MANESTAQPPTPELVGVGSKDLLDVLLDCKMNLLHAINSIHEEELCDDDLNLYNTLIGHADVCTMTGYNPDVQPQSEGWEREAKLLRREVAQTNLRYYDLLMAVARKHEGETRHETAKRYISEAESRATAGPVCDASNAVLRRSESAPGGNAKCGADSESPRTTGSALWGFLCDTCGIRSGHAFVGTKSQALQIAPTCCAFVVMTPVQIGEAPVWPNNAICVKPKEGK